MTLRLTNNATALLSGAITDSDTEVALASGAGSRFPTLSAEGEWFPLTVIAADGGYEIMRVTARSGDVLTVSRAQEGTSAQPFDANSRADLRLTAAAIADIIDDLEAVMAASVTELEGKLSAAEGDSLLFPQSTTPLGWEQDTDVTDRVMRVVSGEGGGVGGSWFIGGLAVGNRTLSAAQMPVHPHASGDLSGAPHGHGSGNLFAVNHTHPYTRYSQKGAGGSGGPQIYWILDALVSTGGSGNLAIGGNTGNTGVVINGNTGNAGGGEAHDHPISHTGAWRPAYMDCIRGVKAAA